MVSPPGIYEGYLKENKYHGEGRLIDENGDVYIGMWVEGFKTGKGT